MNSGHSATRLDCYIWMGDKKKKEKKTLPLQGLPVPSFGTHCPLGALGSGLLQGGFEAIGGVVVVVGGKPTLVDKRTVPGLGLAPAGAQCLLLLAASHSPRRRSTPDGTLGSSACERSLSCIIRTPTSLFTRSFLAPSFALPSSIVRSRFPCISVPSSVVLLLPPSAVPAPAQSLTAPPPSPVPPSNTSSAVLFHRCQDLSQTGGHHAGDPCPMRI